MPRRSTVVLLVLLVAGCQTARTAYYDTWEKFGYQKRERLVDNVKAAQQSQTAAKQQFSSALDEFKSVVSVNGGDLQTMYDKLNAAYTSSASQADAVNGKIASVRHVGDALFAEWQGEVKQIQGDDALQQQSQTLYDKTKLSYGEMLSHMDAAAATMQPVLQKFKNRVLFLKSNLNAQAIASLGQTNVDLGKDIDALLKQMQASIDEADKFIAQVAPQTAK